MLRGLPPSGTSGDVTLICEGKRTVVRIERDLKDPTGAYQHPSREDPAHYGASQALRHVKFCFVEVVAGRNGTEMV